MARDADGRERVHLANVSARARRRRSGLFPSSRGQATGNVPQSGVISIETRGRRSTSQRMRDTSEQLRSLGALFDGSPKIFELAMSLGFVGLTVASLAPRVTVAYGATNTTYVSWGDETLGDVQRVTVDYPNRWIAANFSVLMALLVVRGQGDVGGLLAPAAAAGIFQQFVVKSFPDNEIFQHYDLRNLQSTILGTGFSGKIRQGRFDARATFYLNVVLPRVLRAALVATLFYFIARYMHSVQ